MPKGCGEGTGAGRTTDNTNNRVVSVGIEAGFSIK